MTAFFQQLLDGLSLGAVYALIAVGYTMVYGVLRFINFAHANIFMAGAFIGYYMGRLVPAGTFWGGFVVLAAAMLGGALLGIGIERFAYRPLRNRPTLHVLITAIAVSLLLESTARGFFGAAPRPFPAVFPSSTLNLGGLAVPTNQPLAIGVALLLLLGLRFVVHRTKIGTAMRAVSLNPRAAQLVGINNDVVIAFTFGLGSALAAAGGILHALNHPAIDPLMGVLPGLKALVAAILGGMGSIPGAALGGLLLGVVETYVGESPWPAYKDAVAFAVLILILLFRPAGLLGRFHVGKV